MNNKISIIGLGWLGLALAKKCRSAGMQVFGTTTTKEKYKKLRSSGIDASVWTLGQDLPKALQRSSIFMISIPPSKTEHYCEGIIQLINSIPKSAYVIFCSSSSVYGNQWGCLDENSELSPGRRSSEVLIDTELKLQESAPNRLCILRLAGLIGPKRHPIFRLSGRNTSFANDESVNLVHLDDCISIIMKLIYAWQEGRRDESVVGVYNLSSGEKYTKGHYYKLMAQRFGIVPPIYAESEQPSPERYISNHLARTRFNHTFKSILEYKL